MNSKRTIFTGVLMTFFVASEALAFCTWGIVPPGRVYEPMNATEAFLSYENGVQTLVLKPEWKGDTDDFAIVFPTPSKPEVKEGPMNIFNELENATNPLLPMPMMMEDDSSMDIVSGANAEKVVVVEEKKVGDYDVTVLTATDAKALTEWLEEHKYNYNEKDTEKMTYYVEQGGFYFIALKVSYDDLLEKPMPVDVMMDEDIDEEEIESSDGIESARVADIMIAPRWFGELKPIQISFKTDKPQLPMRTLKSNMPEMVFDLYTLSNQALYVPSVDTVWSNVVDKSILSQVPSISSYNPKGKWLIRQEVKFNPSESNADLYLEQAQSNIFTTVNVGGQVRFDPSKLDKATGVIPGLRGQVVNTDGTKQMRFVRSLKIGSVGEDVMALQKLLNEEGFTVSSIGAGAPGSETSYFGARTASALARYQNYYRADILESVGLSVGTGYFGPSTIKHVNR